MAREAGAYGDGPSGLFGAAAGLRPGRELQGLSLRNVGLAVFEDRKKIYTDFGEMLFTHFGVSGAPGAIGLRPHAALRQKDLSAGD